MKPSRTHFFIALTVCAVALVSYGFLYSLISNKSAAVRDMQRKIDTRTESVGRISTARSMLNEIADNEAAVQDYFIPETGVVAFIDDIERRGSSLGVSIDVLSVSTGVVGIQPTLTLSLIARGTFDAVLRTIGMIEYAPYDLSVSTLSIGQDAKDSWHANFQIVVGAMSSKAATSTQKTTMKTSILTS